MSPSSRRHDHADLELLDPGVLSRSMVGFTLSEHPPSCRLRVSSQLAKLKEHDTRPQRLYADWHPQGILYCMP
jgi:hypothetical protein